MTLTLALLYALHFFLQLIAVDGTVMLTSNITVVSNAELCPGGVKFTCIAQLERQTTLRWFKSTHGQDKQTLATHVHDQAIVLPTTIQVSPRVIVTVFNSIVNTNNSEAIFNSTLEANLSWFVDMNVSSIECGSYGDFGTQQSSYLIRGRPPPPVFTCTLVNNSKSVEFIWDNSYNALNGINNYTITNSLSMNILTFSGTLPSSGAFKLIDGVYNSLIVTPFNCGEQRGEGSTVGINLTELRAPSDVNVTALYNMDSEYSGIEVEWKQVDPVVISEACEYNTTLYYKVVVEDNEANTVISKEVTCGNRCRITLNTTTIFILNITVIAVNTVGQSQNATYNISIDPNPSLNATAHFADCYIFVYCTWSLDSVSGCEIQYSTGNNTPNTVTGPLNELFQLPLLNPHTTYDLQFSTGVNAVAREKTSGTFNTGEFDPRLLGGHTAMITIGCLLLLICAVSTVAFTVCTLRSSNTSGFRSRVVVCAVNFSLFFISLLLWLTSGFYIGLQADTCNTQWKSGRNALISSALSFSFISLVFAVASSVWIFRTTRSAKSATIELVQTDFEEYSALNHIMPSHDETKQTRNLSEPQVLCADYDVMCRETGPRISAVPQIDEYSHIQLNQLHQQHQKANLKEKRPTCADYDVMHHETGPSMSTVPQMEEYSHLQLDQLHPEHQKTTITEKQRACHVPPHNEFESEYSHLGDRP